MTSSSDHNMGSCRVLLFGDLSNSFEDDLRTLLHIHDNPLLSSFLEQAGAKIRDEIGSLGTQRQSLFPRFTTLIDLVSKLGETDGTPILRFCLLSVCQVGQFINNYGRSGVQYPTPHDTYCLGICAGSFAAAAISSAQSLHELIPLAIHSVIISFRTALQSSIVKCDIIGDDEEKGSSWSQVVSGDEELWKANIDDFVSKENISQTRQPYVSAVMPSHVTLSGTPDSLRRLTALHQTKSLQLSIETPYHGSHLFDSEMIANIVKIDHDETALAYRRYFPLISPSSGAIMEADTYWGLMEAVVNDSLREKVRWASILDVVSAKSSENGIKHCQILPLSSNASQLLSTALNRVGVEVQVEKIAPSSTPTPAQHGHFADSKIAIIGYSGRFPDSASNEEFWDLLRAGKDVHREIPEDRFNWKTHYDPTGKTKNTSRVKYGCFIKEPGLFDARFFNISPREAENTDPAQRLVITTVYEAMEMAGMVPNRTPSTQQDRIGCFFGITSDDWREVNSGQDVDTYFIPGGNRAFVPGRISYFFRFSGPSLSMDTACSSSFAAIQTACAYLWRGECDTAVAGGTNVLTNPDNFAGLDRGHFLSTTGNCNAFDDGASGYCRADAVGSVILKRLEDAEKDNDPIFGIISGATTNHCGQTDSITRPHEGDQTSVFKRIIRHAGVNPLDIGYVEMHGTGTQAGDATEMNSVLSVFVPERERVPKNSPLYLGSAKANIGHAESASGVSSLIKVLMMMKHGEIPPHCGIKTKINHNYPLDLKERGVNIAFQTTPWLRKDAPAGKRYAFLNNFSAAGGNTAVLLEDPPLPVERQVDPRTFYLVALSSKTANALKGNMKELIHHLETNDDVSLSALAYTTTARRQQHSYRVVAVGNDNTSIIQSLKSKLETIEPKTIPPAAKVPKVAIMFTGQGSFYCGLGKELLTTVSSFRDDIKRFDRIAVQQGFPSYIGVVEDPDASDASNPIVTQLAITCVQMALFRLWSSWGVKPAMVMGHSLGEYAALFAAGVISASDAIFLVGTRAQLLTEHCQPGTHSMLAVKATVDVVESLLEGSTAEIACLNQPTGNVVSAKVEEINRLEEVFKAGGHGTTRLDVPFAFHSEQVEPILKDFEAKAQLVNFREPSIPFVSPLLSSVISEEGILNSSYLVRACREAVNFQGALEEASGSGLVNEKTLWLEMGPHPACAGMVKGTLGSKSNTAATLRKDTDTWKVTTTSLEMLYLSGIEIDWNEYHRDFEQFNAVTPLPRYSWDLKNYWIMYRNDFCLAKGEGLEPAQTLAIEAPKATMNKFLSPSLQSVLEEEHGSSFSRVLVESEIHDPRLTPIFTGHKVNGAQLCPSSLWADIAMHLTTYLMENNSMSTEKIGLNVREMKIDKPLVFNSNLESQIYRVSAETNWTQNVVKIAIYSVNAKGTKTMNHATATVDFTPAQSYTKEWKRNSYLIRSRMKALRAAVEGGDAHRLKRGIVYRLFANVVEYEPDYQGMQEVILDSSDLEAVSTVQFQVDDQGYFFNPQWIDSLGGVAGFIMNGNESPHPQAEVFINHGWDDFKLVGKLEKGKTYHSYNRMQLSEGTLYTGDTYIFDGDEIVGLVGQIKFLGVPRRALDGLRPAGKPAAAKTKPANEVPVQKKSAPAAPMPPISTPTPPTKAQRAPTAAPKAQRPAADSSRIWLGILAIISEEVGVDLADLKPDAEFADFGLDSLLSLNVTGRMREELDLDLPSTIFVECPTVKDLQQLHGGDSSSGTSSATSGISSADEESGTTTPDTSLASEQDSIDFVHILRSTISEETGIKIEDLTPSTQLDEIGVDSLLALTTMGKLSEIFEVDLPSTIFADNETLIEVESAIAAALGIDTKPVVPQQSQAPTQQKSAAPSPIASSAPVTNDFANDPVVQNGPHATSILLQGSPKTAKSPIFMFPDGSGSASSYATLAKIDPGVAVYGLNCPWRTTPEGIVSTGCNISQYSAKFVKEMRRRQPKGPYNVGGWSAGGICAIEAAKLLVAEGEVVNHLILIDSPNPIGLENPPARMYDFFDELGVFGSGSSVPKWLRPHFDAFISMLDQYEPVPWNLGKAPKTLIVYATDGVCGDPNGPRPEIRPDDPREMIWLLNNRTDFSGDGWASIVGRDRLTIEVVEGVNHFSMMEPGPQMDLMGTHMRDALL